jgi:hypothetical protein
MTTTKAYIVTVNANIEIRSAWGTDADAAIEFAKDTLTSLEHSSAGIEDDVNIWPDNSSWNAEESVEEQ